MAVLKKIRLASLKTVRTKGGPIDRVSFSFFPNNSLLLCNKGLFDHWWLPPHTVIQDVITLIQQKAW